MVARSEHDDDDNGSDNDYKSSLLCPFVSFIRARARVRVRMRIRIRIAAAARNCSQCSNGCSARLPEQSSVADDNRADTQRARAYNAQSQCSPSELRAAIIIGRCEQGRSYSSRPVPFRSAEGSERMLLERSRLAATGHERGCQQLVSRRGRSRSAGQVSSLVQVSTTSGRSLVR